MDNPKIVLPKHKLIEVINKYILPDLLRKKPEDFFLGKLNDTISKGA